MNASKFILASCLTVLGGFVYAADLIISYKEGMARMGKQRKKLKLYEIGDTYKSATGIYMGGYLRGNAKSDAYAIGYISNDLSVEKYWPLENTFFKFFTFKNDLYILDYAGKTFFYANDQWKPGAWTFPATWDVVYSDKFIIACHPRSIAKESPLTRNGCIAPEKKWEITIDWAYIKPTMCNNILTIWQYTHAPYAATLPNDVVQFDPETGKEIARKHGVKNVKDICRVQFN